MDGHRPEQQRISRQGQIAANPAGQQLPEGALASAAVSISHTRDTYLAAKYRRIAARLGPSRGHVAVQRALLVAIWNIATSNTAYHDPGGDYFTRLNPQRARPDFYQTSAHLGRGFW